MFGSSLASCYKKIEGIFNNSNIQIRSLKGGHAARCQEWKQLLPVYTDW